MARPFRTLNEAKRHIIASNSTSRAKRVLIQPGLYEPLALDHAALSGTTWAGADRSKPPVVSGGVAIPAERFKPYDTAAAQAPAWVASVAGLAPDADYGRMISGNEVGDCQHDKAGVSSDGYMLTLARWPNIDSSNASSPWQWANAHVDSAHPKQQFTMNTMETPDAARLLKWMDEPEPWLHGYLNFDWADCYGRITSIRSTAEDVIKVEFTGVPDALDGARWMGVNLLGELDAPGEHYIDPDQELVYVIPPSGSRSPPADVTLMYQPGGVVNVTAAAVNVRLENMEVRDGRHVGILAKGAVGLTIERVLVHSHGTDGIVLTEARDSSVRDSEVHDVGCAGVRAIGGKAETLEAGNLVVQDNMIHHYAQWKRTYMPGVYWGGVGNLFRNNTVRHAPHNGFLGGGDFEDGVDNTFELNTLTDLTYETIDSGGFYSSGQAGTAFTNRNNIFRGNYIARVRNTAGTGFQTASNQGVYLDDQASAWLIENNTFVDCQVGSFIGGGRRNFIHRNRYVRCGTVQYLNNQGRNIDSSTVQCDTVAAPFETDCSTGAAEWMTTQAPAASQWASRWPEMTRIREDHLGWPAYGEIVNNSWCPGDAFPGELISSNVPPEVQSDPSLWFFTVEGNVEMHDC